MAKSVKVKTLSSHTLGGGRYAEVGDVYELEEREARGRVARDLVQIMPVEPVPALPVAADSTQTGGQEGQANDVRQGSGSSDPPKPNATDAAIKLAEEHGIDLSTMTGSGADGRITQPDVQDAISKKANG